MVRSLAVLALTGAGACWPYAQTPKPSASGKENAAFLFGSLFQFNSFDGSLVRRIDVPKTKHANILCEHDGEFIAVTTDKETGRLEELNGSVPR